MELEFVNHASFVIRAGKIRLISDPWLEGTVFNRSWALSSPSRFTPEDFRHITHIWYSHEHPDHFSPQLLKALPEGTRQNLTVLYQQTADRKVADFVSGLGYEVVELELDRWHRLAPELEILVSPWLDGDSWMCARTADTVLFNLNDCEIRTRGEMERIAARVGGRAVDVLLTQFSLSAWEGNPEEVERRRLGARAMLDKAVLQTQAIQPRFVVPFASFVWFCHEENHYMNPEHNRVDEAARYLAEHTEATPVVFYPGDHWKVGEPHDSAAAIARYMEDDGRLADRALERASRVDPDALLAASRDFCRKLAAGGRLRLRLHAAAHAFRAAGRALPARVASALAVLVTGRVRPARIWLWDHEAAYRFDLLRGLRPAELSREECDVALGSESLLYAFQFLWGGSTCQINGRFAELRPDGRLVFLGPFWLALGLSLGQSLSWGALLRHRLGTLRGLLPDPSAPDCEA